MKKIEAKQVKDWLLDGREIAFLDVREHGQYGEGHPFLVVNVPYSQLECDVLRLVPRTSTRLVLMDDGDGIADRAAAYLEELGYSDVYMVANGVKGWIAAGYTLFQGVNLPSKTFGELVEHHFHTPSLHVEELAAMRSRGDSVVVLDGRPRDEHYKMSIPGSICCPNGELAYRIHALVPDDKTPIVIHCAGRTRSIIGAQTLINLGVPNPVYALENGTQGWFLADLGLEHHSTRAYPQVDQDETGVADNRARARALAARHHIASATRADMARWRTESDRTTYVLDVRTPEEMKADPYPEAIHAPGGQLLQSTDQYVGTRGARLVLLDIDGIRAPVVASWLRLMGHDVHLLPVAQYEPLASKEPMRFPVLPRISPTAFAREPDAFRLIDLRRSTAYREAHIVGAEWSVRPRLPALLDGETRPLIFISDNADMLGMALRDLPARSRETAFWLDGKSADWTAAGLKLASMTGQEGRNTHIDYLFFVHDRHDGNKEAARQYLAWETGLIDRLDPAERAVFKLESA